MRSRADAERIAGRSVNEGCFQHKRNFAGVRIYFYRKKLYRSMFQLNFLAADMNNFRQTTCIFILKGYIM